MKKFALTAAFAMAAAVAAPAHATNADGKWQVKVLATGVLPDGAIDTGAPVVNAGVLNATNNTKVNDNVVPTLAVEYFFTPNVSLETICCFTQHHVSTTGAPALSRVMDHLLILPATFTLKAHLPLGAIKPYVGAGVTNFFVFGEKPGKDLLTAFPTVTSARLDSTFGAVLQGGVDIAINDAGLGLSLDAKKYFVRPRSHFYIGATEVLSAKHKLDPWVISGGVYARF